jgi:uncharacterized protein YecE (DUF72 family)
MLPRSIKDAARMARAHGPQLQGRSHTTVERGTAKQEIRHCVEIRHESFAVPEFIQLLRRHSIGSVVADTVEWPLLMDVTTDFVYCRLHGSEQLYASGYEDAALDLWADRVAAWTRGGEASSGRFACGEWSPKIPARDVYIYFDNDMKVRAPFDAMNLRERVQRKLNLPTPCEDAKKERK